MPQSVSPPATDINGSPMMPLLVPVEEWQDHNMHIQIHNKYRKSQAFDQAPQTVRDLFDEHVKQHVMAIVKGQLAQVPEPIMAQLQQQGADPASQAAYNQYQHNQMQATKPEDGGGENGNPVNNPEYG